MSRTAALNGVSEAVARVWVRVVTLEWCKAGGKLVAGCDDTAAEVLRRRADQTLVDRVMRALPADGGADVRSRALAWLGDAALVRRAWPNRLEGGMRQPAVGRFVLTAEVFAEGTLLAVLAKRNGVDENAFRSFLSSLRQTANGHAGDADAPSMRPQG